MAQIKPIQYGTIVGGDFSENEMTIQMEDEDYTIAFVKVAVVKIDSIAEQLALEEFIANLKK